MPRFSFKCHKCSKEMIIYVWAVKDVDPDVIRCDDCNQKMGLMEFSMIDPATIERLQSEIQELHRRLEALGSDEPEEEEPKTMLN